MSFSAKRSRVLGHAELFEPVPDLLHCGAASRASCDVPGEHYPIEGVGHFGRGVLRLVMATLAPPGCLCQPLFPRAADRRWYCVEIGLSAPPSRPARAAHAPGLRRLCGALRAKKNAPAASESPAQAVNCYADETLMPGDRRARRNPSGPLPSSRLLAIDCPRLAIITAWVQVDQWAELGPLLPDRD